MTYRARRRDDQGFTLIELLVVIVILGILSAVVVFAVRGARDKGQGAAVATDARTIRTALEVFCAQKGRYPGQADGNGNPEAEMVAGKYLSDESEYHILTTPGTEGRCPGPGPSTYTLTCDPARCAGLEGTDPPVDEEAICGQGNGWCNAAPRLILPPAPTAYQEKSNSLVPLGDGKILSFAASRFQGQVTAEIFDPAGGPSGTWAEGSSNIDSTVARPTGLVPDSTIFRASSTELLTTGKVLVHLASKRTGLYNEPFGHWELYDPASKVWTPIAGGMQHRGHETAILLANNCGTNCGKVLVVDHGLPAAELYDPVLNVFTPTAAHDLTGTSDATTVASRLNDGRVLVVGTNPVTGHGAKVFSPVTLAFTEVAAPSYRRNYGPAVTLKDGRVLVTSEQVLSGPGPKDELYNHATNTWEQVPTCGGNGCWLVSAVADGSALGYSYYPNLVYRFNPTSTKWEETGDATDRTASGTPPSTVPPSSGGPAHIKAGAPIPAQGACGTNCGKVLVVSGGTGTYLYQSP